MSPFDTSSPDAPPVDLHSKEHVDSPRRNRTKVLSNIYSVAHGSSRMLQQVLGLQPPEPYVRPPQMPKDLEQRFVAGLQEYGLGMKMSEGGPLETLSRVASIQKTLPISRSLGKTILEDVKEEKESPVKATSRGGAPLGLTINTPMWPLGLRAVAGRNTALIDNRQRLKTHTSGCGNVSQRTDVNPTHYLSTSHSYDPNDTDFDEVRITSDTYAGFGPSTNLTNSQPSRPGSSSLADTNTNSVRPHTTIRSVQTLSFARPNHSIDYDCIGTGYKLPKRSSSLGCLTQRRSHTAEGQDKRICYDGNTALSPSKLSQHVRSAPLVLFPSPQVEQRESWDFVQSETGGTTSVGSGHASIGPPHDPGISYPGQLLTKPPLVPTVLPRVNVHEPWPVKLPNSKKRSATSQSNSTPPTAKARSSDATTGLPVLAAKDELLWKIKFPGNTYALLTLILPWSLSMHRMHKQLSDPYLFSINSAFPNPIAPPVHQKLISVAFYDTNVTPHKEIRFIGPGDVAKCSYNEVDIFTYPDVSAIDLKQDQRDCRVAAMRRALGLEVNDQRAKTGSGRWAYILLQGHHEPNEIAPYVMVAWHVSAVTNVSKCLHTIYPDVYMSSNPAPQLRNKIPKRFSSLQQELRSASSSEQLESVVGINGALTLKREVWKMERAGRVPLIEGFRVDVKGWEGWLNAVGMGKGKVVIWKER
jgi:hypothetical protein